jgi:hypothetical protein
VVRVLGAPLAADLAAARKAAYNTQPGAMRRAAAPWRPAALNQIGRTLVAKQCLASKAGFQLAFTEPSRAQEGDMQAALCDFVAAPAGPAEASPNARCLWPRRAIMAVPPREGGMGYPVLAHSGQALRAKLAARLFAPGTQPWKDLVQGLLARAGAAAGLGAAWPVTLGAAGEAGKAQLAGLLAALAPAVRPHFAALVGLGVARVVPPEAQAFHSAMAEPLFGNPDIQVGGQCLSPGDLGPAAAGWTCLRDVRIALEAAREAEEGGGEGAVFAAGVEAQRVLGLAPPAWALFLSLPQEPPSPWRCTKLSGAPGSAPAVFVLSGETPGAAASWGDWAGALFERIPTGRLVPAVPPTALEAAAPADRAAAQDRISRVLGGRHKREFQVVLPRNAVVIEGKQYAFGS